MAVLLICVSNSLPPFEDLWKQCISETFEKPGDFHHPQKDDGLFWSDWWKGAVFS